MCLVFSSTLLCSRDMFGLLRAWAACRDNLVGCAMQTLLPELMERLQGADPGTTVGVLETANSVLKRCTSIHPPPNPSLPTSELRLSARTPHVHGAQKHGDMVVSVAAVHFSVVYCALSRVSLAGRRRRTLQETS